jgi:FtsX-like permease family
VRRLEVSFLARRARSSWLLLACVAVTVVLSTGLAAVLWTFAAEAVPAGAQSILAAPRGRSVAVSGEVNAAQVPSDSQLIRATLRQAWPGVGFGMESALWAAPIELPTPAASLVAEQIQPASLAGIRTQATLTAGTWPGPPQHGAPLPVAVPAGVASHLHVRPGSVLKSVSSGKAALRVTGVFRARDPASAYWGLDLLPVSGTSVSNAGGSFSYGPAVVNPAAFGGALAVSQASWLVLPQARAMAYGNIDTLGANTRAAISRLTTASSPYGLQVSSKLPRLLAGIAGSIVLARSLFTIAALLLLLVAGAGLVLAARLLASLREEESALLRARGATRWQVARPGLIEALALGAVAGFVGVLAGTRLTGVLASLGRLRLNGYTGHGIPLLAWLSALAMLVVCAAVMTWPALNLMTPDAARHRRTRQARLARIAWAGGDVAVLALAALAVWELHGYSAVAHPATGSLGIDPAVAAAPALAVAAMALIPLRGLPLLARLADRMTDRERWLAAAIVSWQIARRPIRQAGPALLVVVATATTTLALAGYASWHQSAADQAGYAVGSDVRVDSAAPAPLAISGAVARAPGVTAATSASVGTLISQGAVLMGATGPAAGPSLIALDAATAGTTIKLRPDLASVPLATLWQRITPRRLSGLAIPGQPARLEVLMSLATQTAGQRFGNAGVIAWIQDGGGNTQQVGTCQAPAAFLPADGRQHAFDIPLSGPGQAIYPLRLLGLGLCLTLPPFDAAHPQASPALRLRVLALATARAFTGPFGPPFTHGTALASWQVSASSPSSLTTQSVPVQSGSFGGSSPQDGTPPAIKGWHAAAGGQQLDFTTGHAPSPKVIAANKTISSTGSFAGQVTIMARPPYRGIAPSDIGITSGLTPHGATHLPTVAPGLRLTSGIPAIATSSYLSANHARIGSVVPASMAGTVIPVKIVASVTGFPTLPPGSQALIADLAAVQDLLAQDQAAPLPVTQWWLSTSHGQIPPRLPPQLSTADLAHQETALLHDQLSAAPRQAMLAIGDAAVLLAALGFSVSVAGSVRERRTQSAVFAALGVGRRAQSGQLCLEQLLLSVPAAVVGLLAGIVLARLMIPSITLAPDGSAPVPSALAIVPLGPAAALALVIAAVPALAAALSAARRLDPAAQLRAEAA